MLGLSQGAFAEACGVSRHGMINFETGKNLPNASVLMAAARLGCDVTYILTGNTGTRSDDEAALLRGFRDMTDADRAALLRAFERRR